MFLNSFPKSILWANPKSMILIRGLGTFLSRSIMFSGLKKRRNSAAMFIAAIFIATERWGKTNVINRGMNNKVWYVHIMEYNSALERE